MFSGIIIVLIISVLDIQVSVADNLNEKTFYKSNGPYFVSREAVNWTDAKAGCQNVSLELVSVTSQEEQKALKTFLRENEVVPKDKWSGYWLSGIRHNDGHYYWDTTGTQVDSSFDGWASGEPSHAYGKEDCIEFKWDEIDLGWNDYFCDEARRYICQIPRKFKPKTGKKKIQTLLTPKEWQMRENANKESPQPTDEMVTQIE